jgi:F-type H+-transporting ATPase subunit a
LDDYLEHLKSTDAADLAYAGFLDWRQTHENNFEQAKAEAGNIEAWKADESVAEWSKAKIAGYNEHLSGKILIPQPFATLRNLYEKESGFAISKYMVLQLIIGLVLLVIFANVAKKIRAGGPPRGYVWNLLEAFLLFIRNDIVAPSVGGHHEEHPEHEKEHGHEFGSPYGEHGEALTAHGKPDHGHVEHDTHIGGHAHAHPHAHDHGPSDVTRLVPLFWTIFFFVLLCNLFGMLPWMGAPTASFSVTTGLALVTLVVGMIAGISKFGFVGYLGNQIPAMDLPLYIAIVVKPLVYAIEVMGLLIKHGVLAIRLLANMVAGHLVILGIMGIAFGATAAATFSHPDTPDWQWWIAAIIAVLASTAFNLLELFVAFLQAYIFTFLSALFIGAAMHKH